MRYEWLIASRYIWSKRRHPFVGITTTISILGITVGVAALIVVLAVMNGFDEDLKERIIGTRAHLMIEKENGMDDWMALAEKLNRVDAIRGAAAFVEGQALIQKDGWTSGVLVRGVDSERERSVSKLERYVSQGALSEKGTSIVVGSELAKRMRLDIGSEIRVLSQNAKKPSVFIVEGLFSSGLYEYDANLVFVNLESAQKLFELGNSVSGLSVALRNVEEAARVKREIQKRLGSSYFIRTWMDMNKTLFGALKLEKMVMFIILTLIILVASLNIAGSLTILVMDKTKDIGILKTLGALPRGISRIFAIQGCFIGTAGATAGFVIGLTLCALLKKYRIVDLPREIYYFDRLPVQLNPADAGMIFLVAVGLSFISALYPAIMAARLDPVKALRYE
jgi:lipoprotein-releasing system permease protein